MMYATTIIDRGGISDIKKRVRFACACKTWWQFSTGGIFAWHIEHLDFHLTGCLRCTICWQGSTRRACTTNLRILFFLPCHNSQILWIYLYFRALVAKSKETVTAFSDKKCAAIQSEQRRVNIFLISVRLRVTQMAIGDSN